MKIRYCHSVLRRLQCRRADDDRIERAEHHAQHGIGDGARRFAHPAADAAGEIVYRGRRFSLKSQQIKL